MRRFAFSPRSLSRRVTVLLAVCTLLIVGTVSLAMDYLVDAALESRFREALLTQARALTTVAEFEQGRLLPRAAWQPGTLLGGNGTLAFELRCEGQPVAATTPLPPYPRSWPHTVASTPTFATLTAPSTEVVTLAFRAAPHRLGRSGPPRECRLLVSQNRAEIDAILTNMDWILAIGPALTVLLVLLLVPWLVAHGLLPIRELGERMRLIGPQAPGQRLAAIGAGELEPLVLRFNEVLARMDDSLARERQFASGLAHETRTRLAELRSLVDVEIRYPTGRSLAAVLAEVGGIGAELEATVTALLQLTRLEAGLEAPQRQRVDLDAWLQRNLALHQPIIRKRQLTVQVQGDQGHSYDTDPALLDVIIGNLISNALQYAPLGSRIDIVHRPGTLEIVNDAAELTDEDLARLGHRFWRKSTDSAGHAGLGLALAYAAASLLGMRLDMRLDDARRLHARVRIIN